MKLTKVENLNGSVVTEILSFRQNNLTTLYKRIGYEPKALSEYEVAGFVFFHSRSSPISSTAGAISLRAFN